MLKTAKFSNHFTQSLRLLIILGASTAFHSHAGAWSNWFSQCNSLGAKSVKIHQIQGQADISPLIGQDVEVQGVITAIAPELRGFYIQEELKDFDNNPQTSEGIFVFSQILPDQEVGDIVKVRGEVQEHFGMTQLKAIGVSRSCGREEITSTSLSLPLPEYFDWENIEGMHVSLADPAVVLSTYNYTRYNEITIGNELLVQPTEIHDPSSEEAAALKALNARSKVTIDDLANGPPSMRQLLIPIDADNSLRIGSTIESVKGVVDFSFERYRVRTTQPLMVKRTERPVLPEVKGDLKIASFNVLNLFNGDGQGRGFPPRRGADDAKEYALQLKKIVNTLLAIDADVVGLNELENDGFDKYSSIAQLVMALNESAGEFKYDYIGKGRSAVGSDSITVGIIYQPAAVTPVGELAVLSAENSPKDSQGILFNTRRNRPSFTQMFVDKASGSTFVVNVNHLKSKGSSCGEGDDSVLQANCNGTRTRAAQGLSQWLASTYPDHPIFIMGDLNSYAQEDPIKALERAEFVNTVSQFNVQSYTYSFRGELGSLDYVLANKLAQTMVVDAKVWHSNAAEPIALDYNRNLVRSDREKPENFRNESPFRASDHDAVIIGVELR